MKPIDPEKLGAVVTESVGLFDTHCHLSAPQFSQDLQATLQRARRCGVERLLVIGAGYGEAGNRQAVGLAGQDEKLCAAVGVHPHEAGSWDDGSQARLENFIGKPRVVAIGEIGLDYHYDFAPKSTQQAVFERQLEFAAAGGLPFIIHTREAHAATVSILRRHTTQISRYGGVIHCFSEGPAAAEAYLDLGLHLGIGGVLTFKTSQQLAELVKTVPADRLLLETDAPYLSPHPFRGRRNEPACIYLVAQRLAELVDRPLSDIALQTTENAKRLFGTS